MQSLLASFRRKKQKLKTTSGMGSEENYDTKWFAFQSLLFLKDKNQPVKTQDTEGNVSKIITEFNILLLLYEICPSSESYMSRPLREI
nr:unnamed protein product [Callosobruchus chinensis]